MYSSFQAYKNAKTLYSFLLVTIVLQFSMLDSFLSLEDESFDFIKYRSGIPLNFATEYKEAS